VSWFNLASLNPTPDSNIKCVAAAQVAYDILVVVGGLRSHTWKELDTARRKTQTAWCADCWGGGVRGGSGQAGDETGRSILT
jgi:hypothetical protein